MAPEDCSDRLIHLFAGECTAGEREILEAWMAADPANRREAERLRALWDAAGARRGEVPDVERMWNRQRDRSGIAPQPARNALRSDRSPVRVRHRRRLHPAVKAGITMAAMVAVVLTVLYGPWGNRPGRDGIMREVATGPGQRARVTLYDGTHVTLNAQSRLTLPKVFAGDERVVQLEGEAYFDVAHDKARPFRVRVRGAVTEVLGTRFSVGAYPDEPGIRVVVDEGKVAVRPENAAPEQAILLERDQMANISLADDRVVRQKVVADEYMEWMDGRLVFVEATIDEVARQLGRWYGVQIELKLSPADVDRLNASFKEESIQEVLGIISETLHLRYEWEGHHVLFYQADGVLRPAGQVGA